MGVGAGVRIGLGVAVGAGVEMIVGLAKEPELGALVGKGSWAAVSLFDLSQSLGKGVGRRVGSGVLKAAGVTNICSPGAGVGSPQNVAPGQAH